MLRILWPLKIHHLRPRLNPRILGPEASTLTTRPPRTTGTFSNTHCFKHSHRTASTYPEPQRHRVINHKIRMLAWGSAWNTEHCISWLRLFLFNSYYSSEQQWVGDLDRVITLIGNQERTPTAPLSSFNLSPQTWKPLLKFWHTKTPA
jgi:hypothetical protein